MTRVTINQHLRDGHGYSLAESVAYSPRVLREVHDRTHSEYPEQQTHTHDPERSR